MLATKTEWCRRPKGMPCPVCGKESWCTISKDGEFARCTRVESNRPAPSKKDGALAWVHSISKDSVDVQLIEKPARQRPRPTSELQSLVKRAYNHARAALARTLLASELGVSIRSLELMRVGYRVDSGGVHTLWPCRNATGEIVGAVRRYRDGTKKALSGCSMGLFYAASQSDLSKCPILVVEGGSDVAAAYTIGMSAIGRPSNTGGADLLLDMNLRWPMVVVGEHDEVRSRRGMHSSCPNECDGCAHCFPGQYGAQLVSSQLGCRWLLPPEGCKDLRDVLDQGRVNEFLRLVNGVNHV